MSDPHWTPPLDSDLASLLERAKPLDSVSPDVTSRMLDVLAARVDPTASGGNGAGRTSSSGWRTVLRRLARPTVLAGTFALGAATGAALRGHPPVVERVVYVDRGALPAPTSSASVAMGEEASGVPNAHVNAASPVPTAMRRADGAGVDSGGERLLAESTLLDVARTAIGHGEGAHALDAVERHAAQFPHGMLVEEREALAVQALHLVGRDDEARARARRFAAAYPKSLFQPIVREATAR